MRKNSIKNTRINKEVMRALADIIRTEIKDPRLDPLTSVMSVEVAPDLKTCKVEVSVLGGYLKGTSFGIRVYPDTACKKSGFKEHAGAYVPSGQFHGIRN